MQWFKGKSSFIVGSDKWLGSQSTDRGQSGFPSPTPPENLGHTVTDRDGKNDEKPSPLYPSVTKYDPGTGLRVRSPTRDDGMQQKPVQKLYPEIYQPPKEPEVSKVEAEASAPVEASEDVLVRVPGTLAHLIDDEGSVHLASGDFSLVELSQNGTGVAVFAKVGEGLQWPVVKDMPTTKLDPSHYVFSLKVSSDEDENARNVKATEETLNYGVTFKLDGNKELLQKMDKLLEQYSYYSAPTILQASEEDLKKLESDKVTTKEISGTSSELPIPGKPVSTSAMAEQKPSEEVSAAFWTTIAPNVDDYNSSLARAIASGTGHIIRGIFWCSDTTVSNLERGGRLVKQYSSACTKPTEVSPRTMKNIRRVKRVTKMSEKVAKGVLTGVVSVTSFFTTSFVNSKAGKKFFKLLPGEVALASLDAFGKIFDAVEVAGSNVLQTSSVVTTGAVSHRYGEQAGEFAHEGLATAGHLFTAAWTISKLRNAINPKNAIKPSSVLKTAAKAASQELKKK